jgi:hypothetical protein
VSIGQATAAIVELTAHRYPFAFRITATEACPRRGRAFRVSRKRRGNVEVERLGVADVELVTGRHSPPRFNVQAVELPHEACDRLIGLPRRACPDGRSASVERSELGSTINRPLRGTSVLFRHGSAYHPRSKRRPNNSSPSFWNCASIPPLAVFAQLACVC